MPEDGAPPKGDGPKLSFSFLKGNYFRVIHVDGAWGGIDPRGQLQMSIFSEREAIPKEIVYELTEASQQLREVDRKVDHEIVREVEAQLVMTMETAKRIAAWLLEKIIESDAKTRKMQQLEGEK